MVSLADLEKVHETGFNLEEVKVTFNRDVKLNVAGINIEAKEGEILNLPAGVRASTTQGRLCLRW